MSDLSRLLGGVYEPGAEPAEEADDDAPDAAATVWHADERLDAAFQDWVPGPSGDASDRERGLFTETQAGPTTVASPTSVSEAVAPTPQVEAVQRATGGGLPTEAWPVETPGTPEAELGADHGASVAPAGWHPEDDDILPTRAGRRFFSLRR